MHEDSYLRHKGKLLWGEPARWVEVSDIYELERKYNELIYAVQKKYPNETRHETALRYIQEAESKGPTQTEPDKQPS